MKKTIFIIMTVLLMLNVLAYANGSAELKYGVNPPLTSAPVERLVPGELNVTINGKVIYFVYKTYATNGVSYVHGEKFLDELGYETDFDKSTGVLTASKDNETLELSVEKDNVKIVDGVLYIPTRATAESMGFAVVWNKEQYLIEIAGDKND